MKINYSDGDWTEVLCDKCGGTTTHHGTKRVGDRVMCSICGEWSILRRNK